MAGYPGWCSPRLATGPRQACPFDSQYVRGDVAPLGHGANPRGPARSQASTLIGHALHSDLRLGRWPSGDGSDRWSSTKRSECDRMERPLDPLLRVARR